MKVSTAIEGRISDWAAKEMALACQLRERSEVDAAISTYRKILQHQPECVEARAALGELYERLGKDREAIRQYRRGLHLSPNRLEIWLRLGDCYYRLEDLDRATQSYERAIAIEPDCIRALYQLGMVLHDRGQLEGAARRYQQVIEYCRTDAREHPDYANAYNNLGCIFMALGEFDRALAVYREAQEISPDSAALYNNLGQLWFVRGNPEEAIAPYRQAIALEPENGLFHYNLGLALQQRNQHPEAIESFKRAIELDPNRLAAYDDCARSSMACGEFGEAFANLSALLQRQPHWLEGYVRLATQRVAENDLERARAACGEFLTALQQESEVLEICERLARVHQYLSRVRFALGDEYGAVTHARRVGEIQAASRWRCWWLAFCGMSRQSVEAKWLLRGVVIASRDRNPDRNLQSIETSSVAQTPPLQGVYTSARDWWRTTRRGDYIALGSGIAPACTLAPFLEPLPEPRTQAGATEQSCQGLNCDRCLKRIFQDFELTHQGQGVYECRNSQPLEFPELDAFVSIIPEGRIWSMPQQNWWQVCEAIAVISPEGYLLEDISREYPDRLPGCNVEERPQHRIFTQQKLPPIEYIDGTVVSLVGLSGNVYFHWMVDVLPRIELLRRSGIDWNSIDGFLVNQYRHPFQKETLTQLGIPPEKIIESDRHPHIQARQLIVPAFSGHLGWPTPGAIDFLRQTFLPTALSKFQQSDRHFPERIYISRAGAKYRHLFNEDEAIEQLQEWGFVSVALETMSFVEQILLFSHAKVIVAPHGSGLTNLIFCQPNTQIIELTSPRYFRHYYRTISQHLNLHHYYLIGEVLPSQFLRDLMYPSSLAEDIYFEPRLLQKKIHKLGVMQTLSSPKLNHSNSRPSTADLNQNNSSSLNSKPQPNLSAIEYQKQAETLLEQKKLVEAIEVSQKAIAADPNLASAYKVLGNALRANGQIEEAKCWYEKAIQIQPLYAEAYANIGNILFQQQQWKPAIEYYQKAIEMRPNFAGAYHHLSKVWLKVGNPRSAADCLYRAYELDPKLGRAEEHLNLGNTLLQQNQLTQAISCYRRALDLNSQLFGAHQNLAEALTRQGRFVEATQYYRMAVKLGLTHSASTQPVPSELFSVDTPDAPSANPPAAIVTNPTPILPLTTPETTLDREPLANLDSYRESHLESNPEPLPRVEISRQTPPPKPTGLGKWLFGMGAAIGTRIGILLGSGNALHPGGDNSSGIRANRPLTEEYLDLANVLLEHQEVHRAIRCYRHAIDATPQMTDAVYRNLETAIEKALAQNEEFVETSRPSPPRLTPAKSTPQTLARGHMGMGDILLRHEELDRAIECYREAMNAHPAVAKTIYEHLESAFEESLNRQKSLNTSTNTSKDGAQTPVLPAGTAKHSPEMNSLMPARHPSSKEVESAPPTPPSNDRLEENSIDPDWVNRALKDTVEPERSVQTQQSSLPTHREDGDRLNLAIPNPLETIAPIEPKPTQKPLSPSIDEMLAQAQTQCQDGNFKEAIGLCKQVIQMQPQVWSAYEIAGEALIGLGNLEEADRHYQKAIILQPKLAKSYLNVGDRYFEKQQWQQAGTIYQRIVRIAPKLARGHDRLGDIWVVQGQLERAMKCYRTALTFEPSIWEIHHKIGDILQAQGKLKEAADAYCKATQVAALEISSNS